MNSIWSDTSSFKSFDKLCEDIKTDVLIIGGGIAGLLCAYELKKSGIDYILIESDRICSGITKNTTAKVTFQHGLIYNKILKKYGKEYAQQYYQANKNALEKIKILSQRFPCDFELKDSYVYSLNNEKLLHKELNALSQIGCNADISYKLPLPFNVKGAVKTSKQAQFNPLLFLSGLSKELKIFENTKAIGFSPDFVLTNNGKINAKHIIIATHFPIINKHGGYFIKMYQHRSYVVAIKNNIKLNGIYVDEAMNGMSFRNYGEYQFIGGGDHRTGKKGGSYNELVDFTQKYYPGNDIEYKWATQDCITLDGIPYVGRYSEKAPEIYVITGFNKWGMTNAAAGAELICDLIKGKKNPYEEVFSPARTIFHPELFINISETFLNFIKPKKPRCPHLGCSLNYNKVEHSWDCPCHGSRFNEKGELIDNPATDDIKNINK